jgi:hypothetical protein
MLMIPLALLAAYAGVEIRAERAAGERNLSTDVSNQTQTQRRRVRPSGEPSGDEKHELQMLPMPAAFER